MKKTAKKIATYLTVSALVLGIATPVAFAQTTTASTTVELNVLIGNLTRQIADLQVKLAALSSAREGVATTQDDVQETLKLIANLKRGMTSDQIAQVQAILAADTSVYPEGLVTGHYGPLTARAITKFRAKYEARHEKFNDRMKKKFEEMREKMAKMEERHDKKMDEMQKKVEKFEDKKDKMKMEDKFVKKFCHIPPGLLRAPGFEKTHQDEWTRLWREWRLCNDGSATTTPDTTSPVISSLAASNVTNNSAKVSWNTNESATSKVYYASTTPVNLGTALNVSNTALVTSHSLGLTGLATSTTYHYVVESKDSSGNTATSSEQSFNTTAS